MKGLSHTDHQSYDMPLELELAKRWDLRTLSEYLLPFMPQAAIDLLYPEPTEALEDSDGESESDSDSE